MTSWASIAGAYMGAGKTYRRKREHLDREVLWGLQTKVAEN